MKKKAMGKFHSKNLESSREQRGKLVFKRGEFLTLQIHGRDHRHRTR